MKGDRGGRGRERAKDRGGEGEKGGEERAGRGGKLTEGKGSCKGALVCQGGGSLLTYRSERRRSKIVLR